VSVPVPKTENPKAQGENPKPKTETENRTPEHFEAEEPETIEEPSRNRGTEEPKPKTES
jgi:hypothetical protein